VLFVIFVPRFRNWTFENSTRQERSCLACGNGANRISKVRIVLADDHPGISDLVEALLESSHEVVGKVRDGMALIEAAARLKPDIIIMDISMPILNGIEAGRKLKESGCRAKLIYLTIHSDCDFLHACMNVGAFGYVLKCRMDTDLLLAVSEAEAGRKFISQTVEREN
jgi:DNA-binding NarL/FixJ family response regulator